MKHVIVLAVMSACQSSHPETERIAALEKRIDALEHARPAAPPRRPTQDPTAVYYLPVHDTDVVRGAADAKVTLVEGFDFACPYCSQTTAVVDEVLKARPGLVRVVSKNYVVHPQVATDAALGACAAEKQKRGAAYEHAVWAQAWNANHFDASKLSADSIKAAAVSIGADPARFASDANGACKQALADEEHELNQIGVGGTPAFFVNGRVYQGPRTVEGFLAAIDEASQRADQSGIGRAAYYDALMKDAKHSL